MSRKVMEDMLIARLETSNVILVSQLPVARAVVRHLVPRILDLLRDELNIQKRELEAKQAGRNAGA